MTRLRIRTIKPEMWADESIGSLSRDARLLLVGLITMADDEGRLRAMPAAILGHIFPYDPDAPKKIAGWISEVVNSDVVVAYEVEGLPYMAFRHWRKHQKINRATHSLLPPPPDAVIVADNALPISVSDQGEVSDPYGSDPGSDIPPSLRAA